MLLSPLGLTSSLEYSKYTFGMFKVLEIMRRSQQIRIEQIPGADGLTLSQKDAKMI